MPASFASFADLAARLADLSIADERRLRGRLAAVRRLPAPERAARIEALEVEIGRAAARLSQRRAQLPRIEYPPALPITDRRDDILAALGAHQVVVVAGETGSGKSTQLPKLCLEAGGGIRGLIGHTQPRRIAARSVAERVAEELGTTVGAAVGYTVRFTDRVGDATLIKVMTDGILLAEIQRDRTLSRYDTIIVDEAHERSLNIDFLLGYLAQLLPRRPDLRLVITSATIDTDRFAAHFGGAPIIEVSGRTFPVEVRYEPVVEEAADTGRDQVQAIVDAVDELCREGPGDILVFLSGEREIHDTAEALAGGRGFDILPLYARLSADEQHRVFAPHAGRRVVLATNVAETSLTVPGIRYVVDPGRARISRYSTRTKVQRLPIEAISQASARQRSGRCGRVAPGVCIRLYSEEDFGSRPEFTDPEILRTNLASVILQMTALGLGDVAAFPFVDPPDGRAIKDGIALLEELGALEAGESAGGGSNHGAGGGSGGGAGGATTGRRLTDVGRRLVRLPVDPRYGRMVLEAQRYGCVREAMIIAAGLSIQDPRERPLDKQQAADELHRRFADPDSDLTAYVRLWDYLASAQEERSSSQFRRMCKAEYLHYLRVREWQDLYAQLVQVGRDAGLSPNEEPAPTSSVHRALLAGLLSHVGMFVASRREYQGARNARFSLFPGSVLAKKPPSWVMAAELVETNRLWGRAAARIDPAWVEHAGQHLVKRSYSEPHWDPKRAGAVAFERVTLYGLPIVAQRRVDYGRIDPEAARELFIRHALLEGEWTAHHDFLSHNAQVRADVAALEDRARRRDLLVDDEVLFDFFDDRLGADVVSGRHFDSWWKSARRVTPDLLNFTPRLLIRPDAQDVDFVAYPDLWPIGDVALAVEYQFDPGSDRDGVTVHIPLAVLNDVGDAPFEWQVPGLRYDLVVALLRAMPKPVRRHFVPAGEFAEAFLAIAGPDDGPLVEALQTVLPDLAGQEIPPGSWRWEEIPSYLRVAFAVDDEHGRTIGRSRDLAELRRRVQPHARALVARSAAGWQRSGLRSWTIETLPRMVTSTAGGHHVRGYPALVDEGDTVGVRVLPSAAEQQPAMWSGTRRLLRLSVPSPVKALERAMTNAAKLALLTTQSGTPGQLLDDAITAALDQILADHGGPVWDGASFESLRSAVARGLEPTTRRILAEAQTVLTAARAVAERTDAMGAPALEPLVLDMWAQMGRLLFPGWITASGAARLADVLRYVKAMDRRLDKAARDPAGDARRLAPIRAVEEEVERRRDRARTSQELAALQQVRWMVEEWRVSVFAQGLGTTGPVSETRIRTALAAAGR